MRAARAAPAGLPARMTLLHWAFVISLALHAAVLSIRFIDPEAINRTFQDTPLEVILVNAKSAQAPDKPQAIAQANLDGGGDAERGLAKSPLPAAAIELQGDAAEDANRRIEEMQEQQNALLAQVRQALAQLEQQSAPISGEPQAAEREERRRQLIKQYAEIAERIEAENRRPKRRFISPSTRQAMYAIYYDNLRRKIERRGTENFPEVAGKKLYGELTMVVLVDKSGRLLATEVLVSSGNRRLDRMAETIVRSAAPFGAFSDEMRRKADEVEIVSRFKFSRDETLRASLEGQ
jgi:protein TonB